MTASLPAGYTIRAPTLKDIPELVTMINGYASIYFSRHDFTEQMLRQQWQEPGFDLAADAWLVSAPDGQPVGYACLWRWVQAPEELRIGAWVCIHPEHENQGIGAMLLQLLEARGQQLIAEAESHARVFIMQAISNKNRAAQQLLEQQDYTETRHDWVMEIMFTQEPLPAEWPDGITIHTFVPGQDDRLVHSAREEAFQDHRGYQPTPFEHWAQHMQQRENFDPTLWFLAKDGAEIAGVCLCYAEPYGGLVDQLGVRQRWRGRGIGMALLRHAFGEFHRRGILRAELGVDAESLTGATRLYERAGMHITDRLDRYEKDLRPGKASKLAE